MDWNLVRKRRAWKAEIRRPEPISSGLIRVCVETKCFSKELRLIDVAPSCICLLKRSVYAASS